MRFGSTGQDDKRRNRRSNPRPNARSVASSSVTEMPSEALESLENRRPSSVLTSIPQNNLKLASTAKDPKFLLVEKPVSGSSNLENRLSSHTRNPTASCSGAKPVSELCSSLAYSSPKVLLVEKPLSGSFSLENGIRSHTRNPHALCSAPKPVSKPCSSTTSQGLSNSSMSSNLGSLSQMGGDNQKQYFAQHWPAEFVEEALKNGDVFKAFFRVNVHNRHEAYCTIDGVPTDILVNGVPSQNRAVEGDVVAVKVDSMSSWTRMKGANNSVQLEDSKLNSDCNDMANANNSAEENRSGHHGPSKYNNAEPCSSRGLKGAENAKEELCSMINSFPSKRPTGTIVAVIERSSCRDAVVGFLNLKNFVAKKSLDFIELMPNDPKLPPSMTVLVVGLPECLKKRLEIGDITLETELIAARIDHWSENSLAPRACISNTLGPGYEINSQIDAILYGNGICTDEFSQKSLACVPQLPWEIPREDLEARRDLRNLCTFTIDPCTATDLDDALSIKRLSDGILQVGIHIADASYFVLPETDLDKEAKIRSTSVYMLKSKLAMLPSLISENIASLNAGADRLAFSMFLNVNQAGDVTDRWIGRTVIRSCCKLSYKQAQEIIDGTLISGKKCPSLHGNFEWRDVVNSVKDLYDISKILKEKRFSNGALVLESSKISFLFDDYGVPYDSALTDRNSSNFLVEELMLLANKTVAEIISRAFPDRALLRKHPAPNARKLKEFEWFCKRHGFDLDASSSGKFHLSLQAIREKHKDDSILFDILLGYATKPMQLASYFCTGDSDVAEDQWGHYSLSVPRYTHFTSPLRRYSDIVVHRILAAVIEAEKNLNFKEGQRDIRKCFTGVVFQESVAESDEGRGALSAAALMHGVPRTSLLGGMAIYCNDRKLASKRVADACNKVYMWALLRRKQVLFSEARVVGLGPKFMSVYVQKFAIERRIYYDEVEGLKAEWLEATSTLVLSLCPSNRRSGKLKPMMDVALVVNTCDFTKLSLEPEFDPPVFPLTLRAFSKIPVALHAIGGDWRPVDIGARLYMSSYFSTEIGCGKDGKGHGT